MNYTPALKQQYLDVILPELMKNHGYSNRHEVPYIEKIVINSGIDAALDKNRVKEVEEDITLITGQKPIIRKARKSISNFKLREGMPVGIKVTLRGANMWDFLGKFIKVALPNTRDFRGISPTSFDGNGNYTIGVSDSTIFPEINSEGNKKTMGMDVTIVTTAETDDEARNLLKLIGMPFRESRKAQSESNINL